MLKLAHLWGFKTINVVRSRPNIDELKAELKEFGADEVYAENEVWTLLIIRDWVLNCGGGFFFT